MSLILCISYNHEQLAEDDTAPPEEDRHKQQSRRGLPNPIDSSGSHPKELRRRFSTESKIFSRERSNSFKTEAQLRALQNPQLRALQNPHYMVIFVYFPSYLRMAMQSPSFLTILLSS